MRIARLGPLVWARADLFDSRLIRQSSYKLRRQISLDCRQIRFSRPATRLARLGPPLVWARADLRDSPSLYVSAYLVLYECLCSNI